jgi:hypothetical protein
MANLPNLTNVSDDAKALAELMQDVLDKIVATYNSYSMPIPDKKYWTFGIPSVDCEQLVVTFIQMYLGAPGDEANVPRRCNDPRSAVLNIVVSRPVPVVSASGQAPTAQSIIDGSMASAYDTWILRESAANFDTWAQSGFGLGVIATIESAAPEGGFQTVTMTITLAVP